MRTQLYIDGELRTVDIENGRITTVNEEPTQPKTGWERLELMQRYYMTNGESQPETYHPEDTKRYENADYFSSPALAADIARAQEIWRKLLRWQAENDEPVDLDDKAIYHYYIYYDRGENNILITVTYFNQNALCVYFNDKAKAEQALEIFYDDLLWLFTKFNPRVDGGAE